MTEFKFGKKPAPPRQPNHLYLAQVKTAVALPTPPSRFGFGLWWKNWGMLGNDEWGDCAWAGPAHETMIFTRVGGSPATFTTEGVLSDYAAGTGFDPNAGSPGNNPTDQGSDMSQVMDYRRTVGIIDESSTRHKIDLGVRLELGNWDEFVAAVYTFGVVAMGFMVPESAQQQFPNQIWDNVGDQNIVGGHYVPVVGSMNKDTEASCITWGVRQRFTKSFFETYADELWVPLSAEVVKNGFGLHHVNWNSVETLAREL